MLGTEWVVPKTIALFVKSWVFPGLQVANRTHVSFFGFCGKKEIEEFFYDIEENVIRFKPTPFGTFF